jgi:RNA polymerase sigma factor (sigma-70 family)
MYKNGKNIIIIDRNVNCVDALLNDVRKTKPLSSEKESQLWEQMQQGSQRARARLIESNMRYAVSVAKRYLPSGAALEDLILAGCEGLTLAADKFNGSLGFRFISFATWYVENEIRKTARDYIKHNHSSLDELVDAEDESGAARIDFLPSNRNLSPDWDIRYAEALRSLAVRAENRQPGAGHLVVALHQMAQEGYSTYDFARRYNLDEQQMSRLLDIISQELSHTTMAA